MEDVGGPRLTHPQLVPIFFNEDPDIDALTKYNAWLVQSAWLHEVGAEYGIGPGSALPAVHRPARAPDAITDEEIINQLFAGLADGSLPGPTGGNPGDTLYVAYFPMHTVVSSGAATSCVEFGGYHGSARRNGVEIAYAVIPTCLPFNADLDFIESREVTVSHEVIEAATDPLPGNHPAFQLRDATSPWLALGGEVGDLCQRGDGTGVVREAGFVAQRSWSNAAAASGDPCVPVASATPYFNLVAEGDTLPRIAPGGHATLRLTGFATAATPDWGVQASTQAAGDATLKLGATMLNADKSTTLDIDVPAAAPVGKPIQIAVFSFLSQMNYQFLPMAVVVGEPCSSFTTCGSCAAHAGCGFCTTTGKCESEGASGTAESGCPAHSFATWPGSCPGTCASHGVGCADCASQPGCGWCATGGATRCMEASHDYVAPAAGSCAYADWSFSPSYCPAP